ncbi:MAG: hypothetical protein LBD24_06535 [Spirochaetaceae bacterium]|jgi:hypothetical protein|nr:hypothetical protein [Spirochaetaceae bacterium]
MNHFFLSFPSFPVSAPLFPLTLCLLMLRSVSPALAAPLNTLLDAETRQALLTRGTVTEVQFKSPAPLLLPRHELTRNLLDAAVRETEPTLFIESLHLYKKPAGATAGVWSDRERRELLNHALALSSLAGIQYYSSSRKAMRTFYEISTVIDGPDTRRALKDPTYRDLPFSPVVVYARQKDLTFGDNTYQYAYHTLPDSLVFVQRNESALSVGIIPAVGRGKLRSIIAVIDSEAYLLVYLSSMAKAASLPGMNQRVGQSFSTRAEALLRWFAGQADKAFAAAGP